MHRFRLSLISIFVAASSAVLGSPVVGGCQDGLDPVVAGRVLLSELNCTRCHGGLQASKGAPDLSNAGSRIQPAYLKELILSPQVAKPGTTMPDVLGSVPEKQRAEVAGWVAEYVRSLASETSETPSTGVPAAEAVKRGAKLYHEIGCVACHAPGDEPLEGSVPLHRLGEKFTLQTLVEFLEDPLAVRPGGRMPKFDLEGSEATDLASFLLRGESPKPLPEVAPFRLDDGRKWFDSLQCAQCHEPEETIEPMAAPLGELGGKSDCTSARYDLSEIQKSWISAALEVVDQQLEPDSRILVEMARLNCLACHDRDEVGGPPASRDAYFTTENLNLGEQARIPPSLTHVGAKLTPEALRRMVTGDRVHRPYMHTRMPSFGFQNADRLVALLSKNDQLPKAEFLRVKERKLARQSGHALVGDKYLSCVACHTFNGDSTTTLNAIDLTGMKDRLRENWFHLYLRNPQEFHDTTIMPSFWPGGKPTRPDILDADAGKQIDAIWQYLQAGRDAWVPSGIRPEPIFLTASEGEAVMLRRQYAGIGKRGIGVGYPSGINLAFDAAQCRLGSVWEGPFAEMSGVWRGQGSGNVKERSKQVLRFPVGPAFAVLKSDKEAWPVLKEAVKAEGFQFGGYALDSVQRPTFHYSFLGLGITDQSLDQAVGPTITRTLSFDGPAPARWFFRVAAGDSLTAHSGNRVFRMGDRFEIELSVDATLRSSGGRPELIVPLESLEALTITYRFVSP